MAPLVAQLTVTFCWTLNLPPDGESVGVATKPVTNSLNATCAVPGAAFAVMMLAAPKVEGF
jgi:hypothetical protein